MSFRDTLHHFKNYFGATIATKALALLSLPILTRWLGVSPADYGVISIFTTYVGIFICVVTLNTYVGVGRYYYENKNDFTTFFGTTVNLNLILLVVVYGIAFLFIKPLSAFLDISPHLFILMLVVVVFSIAGSLYVQVFNARQQSSKIARYSIVTAYLGLGFTIILTMVNPERKYLGNIYSQVVVGALAFIYIFYQLRRFYTFAFDKKHLRYIFSYSVPLIPYFLSSLILGQFDRFMIAKYTNMEDAGLYSFAYNIGMLLTLFFSSVNSAWVPKYYLIMEQKNYAEYDKQVNYIHRLTLCVALGLIYFGGEIGRVLASKNFHSSLFLIPVVVVGYLFFSYFYFWQWNIDFAKKTVYSSCIVGISGIINIFLNVLFIPRYGYAAAAYTTLFSYLCMAALAWGINKFILKIYAIGVHQLYKLFFVFLFFVLLFYPINMLSHRVLEMVIKLVVISLFAYFCFKTQIEQFFKHEPVS